MNDIELKIPLSHRQIKAAKWIHKNLKQWQITDNALHELADRFPEITPEACLIKTTAINSLYQTNVFAVTRMAAHVYSVISKKSAALHNPSLVERIANLPERDGRKGTRKHISFASKFAHFFINPDRYPIYDRYARQMVGFHLGRKNLVSYPDKRYKSFVANFLRLKEASGWTGLNRELDHYLWIAGQYKAVCRSNNARINQELRGLLDKPSAIAKNKLEILSGI